MREFSYGKQYEESRHDDHAQSTDAVGGTCRVYRDGHGSNRQPHNGALHRVDGRRHALVPVRAERRPLPPSGPRRCLHARRLGGHRGRVDRRRRDGCGKSSIMSVISAYSQGLPFALVCPGQLYRPTDPIIAAIMVAAASPIRTPLDLQGKTVAVSAVGDISYLGLRALIDARGGDSSTVHGSSCRVPRCRIPSKRVA